MIKIWHAWCIQVAFTVVAIATSVSIGYCHCPLLVQINGRVLQGCMKYQSMSGC